MKILVTGSSGFLARTLIPLLKSNGHFVIGIDLNFEDISDKFIGCDLRDYGKLPTIDFDICIHLASSVGGFVYNASENSILQNEIKIFTGINKICKRTICKKIIFTSSTNVFEQSAIIQDDKILNFNQKTPYAIAKTEIEKSIEEEFSKFSIIRPTNLFGSNQPRNHSQIGYSHVIPDLFHKIRNSIDGYLEVLGDGSQVRNFLHVYDASTAIIGLLNNDIKWCNVRSELFISISELATELIKITNTNLRIKYNPSYLKYEPQKLHCFDMKQLSLIGWKPQINSIQAGLSEKIDFI